MFYILVDDDGNLRSLKDLEHPENAILFHDDSMEFVRGLIPGEIEKGAIYGPFEYKTYTTEGYF